MIDTAAFGAGRDVAGAIARAGHGVWFVGGCVRNLLMDRPVSDVDLATDAAPETVSELANRAGMRVVPTGLAHGTVTVVTKGQGYEVTTLRRDLATDGRHATVAFASDIAQDAARRDFTMNALYAAPDGTLHDPIGGLPDLQARVLRFIGDPDARIAEDFLRILRFFRFTALYADPDHGIDAEGLAACAAQLDGLDGLSRERIGAEMRKLLAAPDPGPAVAAMARCGALLRILPGAGALALPVLVHVEQAAGLAPDWLRRLAILGGEDVADALRLSRPESTRLARLTAAMADESAPGPLGYRMRGESVDALALRAALIGREIDPDHLAIVRKAAELRFPLTAADLPSRIGPALGAALKSAEQDWIASDFRLTRAQLTARYNRG